MLPTDEGDSLLCQVDQCFVAAVNQMAEEFLKQSSKAKKYNVCLCVCVYVCERVSQTEPKIRVFTCSLECLFFVLGDECIMFVCVCLCLHLCFICVCAL